MALASYALVLLAFGAIGALFGWRRQRVVFGFVIGVLLGPIGWMLILILPPRILKCPHCKGVLEFHAGRCSFCGTLISWSRGRPYRSDRTA